MIIYGLVVLPIIQAFKHHVEDTKHQIRRNTCQVWYDDNLDLMLSFLCIKAWFTKLVWIGPSLG